MMSIVHVIPALTRGGAERVAIDLANAAADRGDSVSIVTAVAQAGDLRDQLRAGIEVRHVHARGSVWASYLRLLPWLVRNRRWIMAQDVIHCHLTFGALFGTLVRMMRAARKAATPALVETYHAVGMPIRNVDRALHAWLLGGRDAVALMALDDYWTRQMDRARVPVMVIPNGVNSPRPPSATAMADYRKHLGLPDDALIVGTVSRLAPERRPRMVLEIFARVAALVGDRAAFLIAGEGPERDQLELDLDRLGLRGRVSLPGLAREPALAFAAIDCYLTLNVGPISGVAGLEAAASGVPVVGYQLRDDYDGHADWIWSSDDIDAVAGRLAALVNDPEECQRLAERQQRQVGETMTVAAMTDAYQRLYETALERRGVAYSAANMRNNANAGN